MKRNLLLQLLMILASSTAMGQGNVGRYEVKVGDFKTLRVVNDINVEYVCSADSAGLAVFYTTPDKVMAFMFDNNMKGKLSIQLTTDEALAPKELPTLRVYSQFLQEAENDGDSLLNVVKVTPAPKIKFKLTGNGQIEAHNLSGTEIEAAIVTGSGRIAVSGKCTTANLRCTGAGEVVADNLVAEAVKCMLVGTGSIRCNVNDGPLSIKGSGTGKIYYRGTPTEIKSFQLGTIKAVPIKD